MRKSQIFFNGLCCRAGRRQATQATTRESEKQALFCCWFIDRAVPSRPTPFIFSDARHPGLLSMWVSLKFKREWSWDVRNWSKIYGNIIFYAWALTSALPHLVYRESWSACLILKSTPSYCVAATLLWRLENQQGRSHKKLWIRGGWISIHNSLSLYLSLKSSIGD